MHYESTNFHPLRILSPNGINFLQKRFLIKILVSKNFETSYDFVVVFTCNVTSSKANFRQDIKPALTNKDSILPRTNVFACVAARIQFSYSYVNGDRPTSPRRV